ncbi:MAG TPA: hypothetical protein VH640_14095 [Bryobacteraceae bacterium]
MRTLCAASALYLASLVGHAGVVDRIAVVVGTHVITQTEVDEEVRVTEFENQEPLNLGPDERRAAAERLIDQQLLRNEIQLEHYQPPEAGEGAKLLEDFRHQNYPAPARFDTALQRYGITQQQLARHLLWQAELVRFVESRFRGPTPSTSSASTPSSGPSDGNAQLDAWLKDARSQVRIEFKKDALE